MPDNTDDNNNAHEIAVRNNELRYGKFLALCLAPDESTICVILWSTDENTWSNNFPKSRNPGLSDSSG